MPGSPDSQESPGPLTERGEKKGEGERVQKKRKRMLNVIYGNNLLFQQGTNCQ